MLKRKPHVRPSAPGEILHELFLKDRKITIKAFAEGIDCSPKHISNIIHGKARIEPELAVRIASALGTSIELWLGLQSDFDVWIMRQKMKNWKPKTIFYDANARA